LAFAPHEGLIDGPPEEDRDVINHQQECFVNFFRTYGFTQLPGSGVHRHVKRNRRDGRSIPRAQGLFWSTVTGHRLKEYTTEKEAEKEYFLFFPFNLFFFGHP
jgi:hypothetical protein